MALSYSTSTGDGATTEFVFSFAGQDSGYFDPDSISVEVDRSPASFTLLSSNTLRLEEAPPAGSSVVIQRRMPVELPYADFSRGNNFGQEILNRSFLQQLYLLHELLDGIYPDGYTIQTEVAFLETATFQNGLVSFNPEPDNPDSVVTFGAADDRYINTLGDAMEGPLKVLAPTVSENPAQYGQLRAAVDGFNSQISNIQRQLTGEVPLEASAFSPISWHDPTISNSVSIPENKNAWSFGPTMTIADSVEVLVGRGSNYTVASGAVYSSDVSGGDGSYDGGYLT